MHELFQIMVSMCFLGPFLLQVSFFGIKVWQLSRYDMLCRQSPAALEEVF